jgi:predicted KAP-like P-loop ATPase
MIPDVRTILYCDECNTEIRILHFFVIENLETYCPACCDIKVHKKTKK